MMLLPLLVLPALGAGCEAADRARSRFGGADTAAVATPSGSVLLGLQAPGALRPGEEGVLRLAVTNRGDTAITRVHLELIVPGWAEPMPPRAGDREVGMTAMDDGSTRFSYRVDDAPLEPNGTHTVEQRIRIPTGGALTPGAEAWTRIVRARLLGPDGRPLAEVESEVALDGVPAPDAPAAAGAAGGDARDRLGEVRLGMTSAAVRQAVPAARDTTWTQEGLPQRGLVVAAGGGTTLAVLSGDSVARIEARDPAVRTRERLGVGSRLEELRAAYGTACGAVVDGAVLVWFASAPGVSFALDAPPPADARALRDGASGLPASARVTRWWLHRGTDRCG